MQHVDLSKLLNVISNVDLDSVIPTIELGLFNEEQSLATLKTFRNKSECKRTQKRITETKVFLTFLYLRRLSGR
jgi:hypothetical protein